MPKIGSKPEPVAADPKKNGRKKTPPKDKSEPISNGREVLYHEPEVRLCVGPDALGWEAAKEILGWEEETEERKFGNESLLTDINGKKVRCYNNTNNRPFQRASSDTIAADILRGYFKFNGESMIVGNTGLTLSCQHRLAALVLAHQKWEKDKESYPFWGDSPPVIDCILVFGVDEADDVVNTLDTGKPRTLSDVLYRSEYFSGMTGKDREKAARIAAYGVRTLWLRTGASATAFTPKRTHSEMIEFIERHSRLIDCVKHIHEENDGGKVDKFIGAGYAAGLMYLMSACEDDGDQYRLADPPSEDKLAHDNFDKASEFWTLLAGGAKELSAIRTTLGDIINSSGDGEDETGDASLGEKTALVVKAWNLFQAGAKITPEKLKLEYHTDDDGIKQLAECPVVGGIDVGDAASLPEPIVEPEEVEERTAQVRGEKNEANGVFKIGEVVNVADEGQGAWQGRIKKKGKTGMYTLEVMPGFDGAGGEYDSHVNKLSHVEE